MLLIAVNKETQGTGRVGTSLIETELKSKKARILLVDTSSEMLETQAFYKKRGFVEEARICEFWSKGEDKIVFWKKLE